eukprot:CAMPEP_0172153188 /NCGR_PEP_ID=MMETSP1050-20130122/1286_1 /TAXON_ID=233186 /ORGANISM="Cryptomonas curvata, Strain CCAP979/52" /LENGTH=230 /DNA_ID=CAMNT_0012821657 /DNA_START=744 /DNA_END=1433 /DNA_ORIENTATION=+
MQAKPGPSANAVLLYTVGKSIMRKDRDALQSLLDQFHSDEAQVTYKGETHHLQDLCRDVCTNATRYLKLDDSVEDLGQRYIALAEIPRGTLLAAYFGSLERLRPRVMDSLNHSMAQGKLDLDYVLFVDGTPREGDTRPGRFQLFNHCCEPGNNAVCEEWECRETGLFAYFLRSSAVIAPRTEVRFPYQQPTIKNGVQVYPANKFWKKAADLPPASKNQRLVECNCAGKPG